MFFFLKDSWEFSEIYGAVYLDMETPELLCNACTFILLSLSIFRTSSLTQTFSATYYLLGFNQYFFSVLTLCDLLRQNLRYLRLPWCY